MNAMRWCLVLAASVAAALMLGCAPAPKKPTVADVVVIVSADVNPDLGGRPSPVIVRAYELKSLAAFNAAHYSAFERDKESLGADLLARDEMSLKPGQRLELKKTLQGETRYLGVTAAFRDLEHSKWRATATVPAKESTQVEIRLDRNDLSVTIR